MYYIYIHLFVQLCLCPCLCPSPIPPLSPLSLLLPLSLSPSLSLALVSVSLYTTFSLDRRSLLWLEKNKMTSRINKKLPRKHSRIYMTIQTLQRFYQLFSVSYVKYLDFFSKFVDTFAVDTITATHCHFKNRRGKDAFRWWSESPPQFYLKLLIVFFVRCHDLSTKFRRNQFRFHTCSSQTNGQKSRNITALRGGEKRNEWIYNEDD